MSDSIFARIEISWSLDDIRDRAVALGRRLSGNQVREIALKLEEILSEVSDAEWRSWWEAIEDAIRSEVTGQ